MKSVFALLFVSITCFAQEQDSLLYQLLNISNDTERVNQLYQTGFNLRNTDAELSYQYARSCEQQALKSNSPKHLAKSYNLLGILYYKKANYNKALTYQKKALNINDHIKNLHGIAINQTNLGNIYSDLNSLDLAETAYLKALHIYNQLNDKLLITKTLLNIGVLKYEHHQLEAAVRQFKEALNFAEQLNDYDLMASCNNNIGTIYREQLKLDSALAYLYEAIKQRELTGNEMEMADSYNNIANVFIKEYNFVEAENYIHLADSIATKFDYLEAKVEIYDTKVAYYEAQQKFEDALFWNKKHHSLKDSLKQLNTELNDIDFTENTTSFQVNNRPSSFSKILFICTLSLLLIGIPLYLIRYKR